MSQVPYHYKRLHPLRYMFVSDGGKRIEKIVEFLPLGQKKIVNLAFGDALPDGTMDDMANSNNGDIRKVLSTNTEERIRLYNRIIKTSYQIFSKEFVILGALTTHGHTRYSPYNPDFQNEYLAIVIKRIS